MTDFDPQVIAAMARWPNVPAVYGWLRLDRRGQWHLIDRGRPDFDPFKDELGSPITSPPILDFIHRNYAFDSEGRWFWQNGPQRVYVDLDWAPRILRVLGEGQTATLIDHTGLPLGALESAVIDPDGSLWLTTTRGYGAVHDLDLAALELDSDADGRLSLRWQGRLMRIETIDEPGTRFGFVRRPRPEIST